jgi:hypothetical protein
MLVSEVFEELAEMGNVYKNVSIDLVWKKATGNTKAWTG